MVWQSHSLVLQACFVMSTPLQRLPRPEQMREESTSSPAMVRSAAEHEGLRRRIGELGEWFHNLDLHGVPTAPDHFLGDFPNVKWKHIAPALPADVSGATVLDI